MNTAILIIIFVIIIFWIWKIDKRLDRLEEIEWRRSLRWKDFPEEKHKTK